MMKSIDLYFHSLDKYMKGLFLTHYTIVFRKSGDSIKPINIYLPRYLLIF